MSKLKSLLIERKTATDTSTLEIGRADFRLLKKIVKSLGKLFLKVLGPSVPVTFYHLVRP